MRRWVLLAVLCVIPVGATAQTIDGGVPSYVVGNTLVAGTPMVMLANGKGHGKGHGPSRGGAPAPSAAPAPAQSFSEGRGESGYSFQAQPLRVQIEGPTVVQPHPVITWPQATQYPVVQPVEVSPIAVQPAGTTGTLTIPVEVTWRRPVAQVLPQSLSQRSLSQWGGVCPTGCVVPVPEAQPRQAPLVCNAAGHCISWP